nr:bifunctional sugar-1-phosphate nucleotidylyltransferase/acetyltransferase [Haloferax larsenii]
MNAIVPTAGTGTRLHPLTDTRPKAMLPVGDKPLLEHIVEALQNVGIDQLTLVVGHKRERIQNHFQNGSKWNVDIQYAVQDNPRGTGDALLTAEHEVSESCIVINGDRIVEPELIERLIEKHEATGDACLAVTEVEDPLQYGAVEIEDGHITAIEEKPDPHEVTSNLVNAGVYAFGPEIFAAIRQTDHYGELQLTDTLNQYIKNHPLHAVHYDGMWLELSRPWDLLSVNSGILARDDSTVSASAHVDDDATLGDPVVVGDHSRIQPGARVLRNTVVGENVTIGANAVITNSVILEDAVVGPGTVVSDSIIGAGSEIGPLNALEGGTSNIEVNGELHTDVRFGGLVGDGVTTGSNVTITPGTIVGNRATIESGSTLSERVPGDAHVFRG